MCTVTGIAQTITFPCAEIMKLCLRLKKKCEVSVLFISLVTFICRVSVNNYFFICSFYFLCEE